MMRADAMRTLRTYPREAFGVLVVFVAFVAAVLGLVIASAEPMAAPAFATVSSVRTVRPAGAPPAPEPLQFKPVTADDARSINAAVPFSPTLNPAARPLTAKFADVMNEARALDCLTAAVYYEAAIEGPDGQRAVAQVVLNRLRHPAYPKTVCGVVFQGSERTTGCQFTFTCDGALMRTPIPALWQRARVIAWGALSGQVFAPVGWATHYHTDWVVPYWASSLAKATKVGTHIFYRWMDGWGRGPAFTGRYAGVEPIAAKLAVLSNAHQAPFEDVAIAAGDALDQLAKNDPVPVATATGDRMTMTMQPAGAPIAGVAGQPVAIPAKPAEDAKVPWELRWALTGNGPAAAEPALGPAASVAAKPCVPSTATKVPVSGKDGAAITVRETCGG